MSKSVTSKTDLKRLITQARGPFYPSIFPDPLSAGSGCLVHRSIACKRFFVPLALRHLRDGSEDLREDGTDTSSDARRRKPYI